MKSFKILMALSALPLIVGGASSAQGATPTQYLSFSNNNISLTDVSHASVWNITKDSFVQTVDGKNCLDTLYDNNKVGNPVAVYSCNGDNSQKWSISNGKIKNSNGLCIGANKTLQNCSKSPKINLKTSADKIDFSQWKVRFADDFNGTSLNSQIWTKGWFPQPGSTITNPVNNIENNCYDANNISVENGNLNLRYAPNQNPECSFKYAGALITSNHYSDHSFDVYPGDYVEAKIKVDAVDDKMVNWPSFWLNGQPDWPANGETDIIEGAPEGMCFNIHDLTAQNGSQECHPLKNPSDYHIYGAYRTLNNTVEFYYDGVKVGTKTLATNSPEYIVLGVGSTDNGGVVMKENSSMSVDYVKVYQKP